VDGNALAGLGCVGCLILCDGCGKPLNEGSVYAEVRMYGPIRLKENERYDWCSACVAIGVAAINKNKPERKPST
jgi:hypothetical protein